MVLFQLHTYFLNFFSPVSNHVALNTMGTMPYNFDRHGRACNTLLHMPPQDVNRGSRAYEASFCSYITHIFASLFSFFGQPCSSQYNGHNQMVLSVSLLICDKFLTLHYVYCMLWNSQVESCTEDLEHMEHNGIMCA